MEQREVDNMLLSMIQKHFPSLPLSDEHTDWGKWLGFARAVYEAGRASPASAPEVTDGMALAFHHALTDGSIGQSEVEEIKAGLRAALAASPTPQSTEDRKDAERYRALKAGDFSVEQFVSASYGWKLVPTEELDAAIDAATQEDKP